MGINRAVDIPDLLYSYYTLFGPLGPESWDEYLELRETFLKFKSKKKVQKRMQQLSRAYRLLYGKSELRRVVKITNDTYIDPKFRIIISERLSLVSVN